MITRLAMILALLASSDAVGATPVCKGNPALTGRCYWTTGSYGMSADMGFVLTRRAHGPLYVSHAPNGNREAPPNLDSALDQAKRSTGWASPRIAGRFLVCPIPAEPSQFPSNTTPFVCIETATRLKLDGSP